MDISIQEAIRIPVDNATLMGELVIPPEAKAIIIFSHGSGSSRFSRRNQQVAEYLEERGFGTLLFDLLTKEEDRNYFNRFNIELLSERLVGATGWIEKFVAKDYPLGFFGASTGAASALKAAVELSQISCSSIKRRPTGFSHARHA